MPFKPRVELSRPPHLVSPPVDGDNRREQAGQAEHRVAMSEADRAGGAESATSEAQHDVAPEKIKGIETPGAPRRLSAVSDDRERMYTRTDYKFCTRLSRLTDGT